MRRVSKIIKDGNFDLSIDMQKKFRSSLLAYMGKVRARAGYHHPGGFLCNVRMPDRGDKHSVDRNLDLLKPLGIVNPDRKPELMLSQDDRDYAQQKFDKLDLNGKYPVIGIFPGAGWRHRCWLPERFAAVGDLAADMLGATVVVFGGVGETDIVDNIAKNMKTSAVLLKGNMKLRQLAAMIEKCHLFLSNDTGPMHISVAVNTPTIGLFGPGNHIKFQPIGEGNTLIRHHVHCNPCKQFTNRCKDNICMKLITVDEVWEAIYNQLKAKAE
jgi:lipopolysaccharide heptosyltransferase II